MIALSAEVRIHLALGATDLRKGFDGLAALVQQVLHEDPFGGHLFVFRGKRACSGTGAASCSMPSGWSGAGSCGRRRARAW